MYIIDRKLECSSTYPTRSSSPPSQCGNLPLSWGVVDDHMFAGDIDEGGLTLRGLRAAAREVQAISVRARCWDMELGRRRLAQTSTSEAYILFCSLLAPSHLPAPTLADARYNEMVKRLQISFAKTKAYSLEPVCTSCQLRSRGGRLVFQPARSGGGGVRWLDAGAVNVSLSAALEALESIYHWAARITQGRTSLPKKTIDIDSSSDFAC